MKRKNCVRKYISALVILSIALTSISCSTAYANIQASLPDLTHKADGAYRGTQSISGTPVRATVDVVIRNRVITSINIVEHFCSPIGKKAERIVEKIVEQQSLDIDVVSGATASSKAILKAVENALQ